MYGEGFVAFVTSNTGHCMYYRYGWIGETIDVHVGPLESSCLTETSFGILEGMPVPHYWWAYVQVSYDRNFTDSDPIYQWGFSTWEP